MFGLPDNTTAALLVGAVALPWTLFVLFVTRRDPAFAINPIVPIVDFSLLVLLEVVAPETVGAVRVAALFLVASHAHFQGERRGMAVAALGSAALVIATAIRGDEPVDGDVWAFYELVFVVAALATGVVVGTLRTAESASRLRAQGLSRRTLQAEGAGAPPRRRGDPRRPGSGADRPRHDPLGGGQRRRGGAQRRRRRS